MRWRLYAGPFAVLALACVMALAGAGMAMWGLEKGNSPHYFKVPVQILPPVVGTLEIPRDMQPKPRPTTKRRGEA